MKNFNFLEERKKGIGGSDIAAILGENDYKTAYEVYLDKVESTTDNYENKATILGNLLEPALIERYELINNIKTYSTSTFRHSNFPFLIANTDAIIPQQKKIVEIKTASSFNKDEWGATGSHYVPKHYYAQIAHYMLVMDYESADIFVGFVDNKIEEKVLIELAKSMDKHPNFYNAIADMEVRHYHFERDNEFDDIILEEGIKFYNDHLMPWLKHGIKNPPAPNYASKKFQEIVKKKYRTIAEEEVMLPESFTLLKNEYVRLQEQIKVNQLAADTIKTNILDVMKDAEKAVLSDGDCFLRKLITRKEYTVKAGEYVKFSLKRRQIVDLNKSQEDADVV